MWLIFEIIAEIFIDMLTKRNLRRTLRYFGIILAVLLFAIYGLALLFS